jgi:hypothetical protein
MHRSNKKKYSVAPLFLDHSYEKVWKRNEDEQPNMLAVRVSSL